MRLNLSQCSADIRAVLNEEKEVLGICFGNDGVQIVPRQSKECGFTIEWNTSQIIITYHKKTDFCRGLLTIYEREIEEGMIYKEQSSFEEFGVMLDFSRNAVMRVEQIKQFIRVIALMGYQFLGLYIEDTIEVEGEPYLGYMRGAMTAKELREIDTYAKLFDIEIRAYIQTLAHVNQITRYEAYREIMDTDDILLVGEEKTYQFLENLIRTISENLSSHKINIGMDEAHMIGLGKYLNKNGFCKRFDIMKKHLDHVMGICRKYGFQVQMWSDMFFRLAYDGEYYIEDDSLADMPEIPDDVDLIYWDYYSCDQEHYDRMLKRHFKISDHVGFAGGAWKWTGFSPHNTYSMEIGKVAMQACKDNQVKSVVITAWGDNGAETSNFSILPALYADAEYNYTGKLDTGKFEHITNMTFDDYMQIEVANNFGGDATTHNNSSKYLLYNDVFLGTFDSVVFDGIAQFYKDAVLRLEKNSKNAVYGYIFETQAKLCSVLQHKADLGKRIKSAYDQKDRTQLSQIEKEEIPQVLKALESFYQAFEAQWVKENKTFGFEVQCIRIGGLQKRLEFAQRQLKAYTCGEIEEIEELEVTRKAFNYFTEQDLNKLNYNLWHHIVSPSAIV